MSEILKPTLGLDPATACGWAHSGGTSGVWHLGKHHAAAPGLRLHSLWRLLRETLAAMPFEVLAYEEASYGSHHVATQGFHAKLAGIVLLFGYEHGIETVAVNPAQLKKQTTGHGRATKSEMQAAVLDRWKHLALSDDEADAYAICQLVARGWRPGMRTTPEEAAAAAAQAGTTPAKPRPAKTGPLQVSRPLSNKDLQKLMGGKLRRVR